MKAAAASLILCTCPDAATAETLANALVSEHLAACVNIIPGISSIYEWQDQVEHAAEVLILIKYSTDRYAPLESRLLELHPYELPEILSVPIQQGLPAYLNWIDSITGKQV